jgi:hypothetical protein
MATEVEYFRYVSNGTSTVTRWVTEHNSLKAELCLKFDYYNLYDSNWNQIKIEHLS